MDFVYSDLTLRRNFPLQRYSSAYIIPMSCPERTAHIPDRYISCLRVLPHQIRVSVVVEVPNGRDLPGQGDSHGTVVPDTGPLRAVHIPDRYIPGRTIFPDQIRFAVFIEVGGSDDLPGQWDTHGNIVPGAGVDHPIHIPDRHIPCLRVLPNDVHLSIAVEVGYSDDL